MLSASPAESNPPAFWRRDLLLLLLAFGALYGFRLGSYPLSNPDEGRNAEIAREMLATGDWVTPRLNGVNYFEKPPLVYWVTAELFTVFGQNEWSVRAQPALFALLGILFTYGAARALHGRMAGLLSAVVLGTSLLWFAIGHIPILDMAVSVFMAAALFCFILGVREPAADCSSRGDGAGADKAARPPHVGRYELTGGTTRRRWFLYGLYVSMALATLAKGLMGFLVTGAVMFLWLLVFNQWHRLRPLYLPSGVLIFLVLAAPWHVLAAQRNETWVHRYLVFEHFERFLTSAASRPGPIHYFVWIVLAGLIPWTGFLWPAVRDAVCRAGSPNPAARDDRIEAAGSGDPALQRRVSLPAAWARRKENADAWFFVTWVAFVFFFFSISKSKLPPYILPIFPGLAVLIGAWLAKVLAENAASRLRWGLRLYTFVNGLLAVALLVAVLAPGKIIRDPAQAQALLLPACLMAAVLLTGGVLVPWLARVSGVRTALAGSVATMAVFLAALQFAAPDINKPGTKTLAHLVRERAKPGDRVLHYHEFFHDFTFYAARVVDVVAFKGELELEEDAAARASGRFMDEATFRSLWTSPTRVFAAARKRDVKELFGDAAFRYHLLAESRDHYLFSNQP
ncbi:MAG: glycosyltransferase family 39 protein [Verrucomicrobia bacterium]|nr:glycosyltransferase family 39 protein [Verrucomicrobiota bacterium]